MSNCPYCKKKIPMSKAFCSRECKENYFQLIAIQIPRLFLKRIFLFCNKKEREIELLNFAKRHNWRIDLVKNKSKLLAKELGYIKNIDFE